MVPIVADTGEQASDRRAQRLAELRQNPNPAAQRAAIAAKYPAWGLSTMGLLVVGVVAGYFALIPHGVRLSRCGSGSNQLACAPADHPLIVVLPVAGLVVGLMISLIVGRLLAKRDRSPVPAAIVGWVVFVIAAGFSAVMAALR